MEQTIRKIGNSLGVIIPNQLITKLGLEKGSKVTLEISHDSTSLVLRKDGVNTSTITPDFMKKLEEVNSRYGVALKKLANQK